MTFPTNITYRDIERAPAVDQLIDEWCERLETAFPRIERCDVLLERPHQHHHQGQRYHVRITLAMPGPDVVVSRDHSLDAAHEDLYTAVRDAFHAARRQVEDHARRLRGDVKRAVEPAQGRVTYVDVEGDWGYLEAEGRQIYWNRNSVVDNKPLAVGDEVRFREERGDKGPQASSVTKIGEHGHHATA